MKNQDCPQNRIHRILPVVFSLLPVVAFLFILQLVFGWNIFDYVPFSYNDEVGYWHYIRTFSQTGFDGGYYSPNEKLPPVGAVHFDAHGPVFPMFYGAIAAVTGWQLYTGAFFNMVLLTIALLIFTWGLDRCQVILTGLAALTFWPILMYMGSIFQESVNQAIAIFLALVLSRLLAGEWNRSRSISLIAVIVIFGLLRYTWLILLVPLSLCLSASRSLRWRLAAVSAACLLAAADIYLFVLVTPPGSDTVFDQLGGVFRGEHLAVAQFLSRLAGAFGGSVIDILNSRYPMGTLLALQVVLILVLIFGYWIFLKRRSREPGVPEEVMFHFLNLAPVTVAVMLFDITFDRVVGPHLLLSLLILTRRGPRWIAGVIIAVNLIAAPVFVRENREWWERNYTYDKAAVLSNQEEVARLIRYQPDAESPWCNTILILLEDYNDRVLAIPGGIGVSFVHPRAGSIEGHPRSKYLLGDNLISRLGIEQIELLSDSPIGKIYLNLESACPGDSSELR